MGQVLIRNIDDEVLASLRYKAKVKGRPLEQELREILTIAAPFTADERVKVSEWLQSRWTAIGADLRDFDFKKAIRSGRDDEYLNNLDDSET
jgi:antitoxin FitA